MQTIVSNNLSLVPLTEDKIELLRQWRNDTENNQFLIYREHISEEQQKQWWKKNQLNDNYQCFFICYQDEEVGYTELKHINKEEGTAEYGIVITSLKYRDTPISIKTALMMFNYASTIGLKTIWAVVLKNNPRALNFNKHLGYAVTKESEEVVHIELDLAGTTDHRNNLWKFFANRF